MRRTPSARRRPFHTWSISPATSWPTTARDPLRPFGKVPPSSCAQTTTSTGWRVVRLVAAIARTTSMAASEPSVPSKLPPPGTESMCEPIRHRARRRGSAGARGKDVAGRVDAGRESGAAHELHDVPARGDVGVGVRRAADAVGERAPRRAAELAQRLEPDGTRDRSARFHGSFRRGTRSTRRLSWRVARCDGVRRGRVRNPRGAGGLARGDIRRPGPSTVLPRTQDGARLGGGASPHDAHGHGRRSHAGHAGPRARAGPARRSGATWGIG